MISKFLIETENFCIHRKQIQFHQLGYYNKN